MTRSMGLSALVAALLVSCAGFEPSDPQLMGPWVLHQAEPEPERCGMAFDPAPELAVATQSAAQRWSAATGCDVRVEAGGIKLVVLPEVIDNAGRPTQARTTTVWVDGVLRTNRIEYRADSLDQAGRIVPHEIGHALGGYGHSDEGVMREAPRLGESIDAGSLALVCERLPCEAFAPER